MNVVYDFSGSILDSYWEEIQQGKVRFAFFNAVQPHAFYQPIDHFLQRHTEQAPQVHHFQFSRDQVGGAYAPVLELLRSMFDSEKPEYIQWQQNKQIPTFIRHNLHLALTEQTPDQPPQLFLNEVKYLKSQLHYQLLKLLQIFVGTTPHIISLTNLHLASPTIQELICSFLQYTDLHIPCLFSFQLNRRYVFQTHDQNEHWHQFLLNIESQHSLINLANSASEHTLSIQDTPYIDFDQPSETLLQLANEQHILLAFTESNLLLENILEDSFELSEQQIHNAELLLAKNYYFLQNNQQSIAYLERMKERAHKQNAQDILTHTYALLSLVYRANYDYESAVSNAFKSLNHARNTKDDDLITMALFIFDQSQTPPLSDQNWEQLLSLLDQNSQRDHFKAYALKNSYTYHDYYEKHHDYHHTLTLYQRNCQFAVDYFEQQGLLPALAEAHHDIAIINSLMDNFEDAVLHLQTSKSISESLNDTINIVRIINGMGYLYFLRESFETAFNYFIEAFHLLQAEKDYQEICSTLFNLGLVSCQCREYSVSFQFFDTIQKLMSILNFAHIPYHTSHEVNIMRAFCLVKMDETTKAMEIMNNLPGLENHKNSQTAFFYVMVSALIADKHHNHVHAIKYFQLAKKQLKLNIKSDVCLLPLFYLEYAIVLKRISGDFQVEIDNGIQCAEKLNYSIYIDWLKQLPMSTAADFKIELPQHNVNLNTLLEFAKTTQRINSLQHNINKIKFLHQLQNLLFKEHNKEKIASKALILLQTFFPLEFGAIYLVQDGDWHTYCCKLPVDCDPKRLLADIRIFIYTKQLWLQHYSDEDEHKSYLANYVKYAINIPLILNGNIIGSIFLATHEQDCIISNSDTDTLSIAAQQLTEAFNRIDKAIELKAKNEKLEATMQELTLTQKELVEAEKMASLGQLVAGVAHEINTPIGVAITATTFSINEEKKLSKSLSENQLSKKQLTDFLEELSNTNLMVFNNLQTASKLIKEFKQVAVDQNTEEKRHFRLHKYLSEIIGSLTPQLKQHQVTLNCEGEQDIDVHNYPGVLYQIISNFVMNSIYHGFQPEQDKCIHIHYERAAQNKQQVILTYRDTGCGISPDIAAKVFEPFFTTRRNKGGTGLGLHIVYNLVVQKMRGSIQCIPNPGQGAEFIIKFPCDLDS